MLDETNEFRLCLFLGKHFPGNHFPNFPVFICHQESWLLENTFRSIENTFQSMENIFRSTKNTFQSISVKKILTWFSGKCFPFNRVCFPESGFWKITFQTFLCLFASKKVGQWKTLSSKMKVWLGFQESVFLKNLRGKHFPEVVKNLKISLFADYIKFDPLTFDCYIYFLF